MVTEKASSSRVQRAALAVALLFASAPLAGGALPSGVASGEATQTSTVLWARSTVPGTVTFDYSTDPSFTTKSTATVEVSDPAVPAKVEISGLDAGSQYYYRATDAEGATADGRFRTPAPLAAHPGVHFGASGDWQQAPPYPSLSNVPGRDLDFFIKLGDTIYADQPGLPQARTLDEFRAKHAQSTQGRLGVNFMAPLSASTSLLQTTDDHEIVDNYAGGAPPGVSPDASPPLFTDPGTYTYVNDTPAYQAAMQAFRESHPARQGVVWSGTGDDRMEGKTRLYRTVNYGSDAAMFILDGRSFRDVQLPPVGNPLDPGDVGTFVGATFTPGRTLLGRAQLDTLKMDLLEAQTDGVAWKFVVVPEPIQNLGVVAAEDRFEGYAAERTELLQHIQDSGIQNVVFLAADHHGTMVNNLAYQELLPVGPGGSLVPVSSPISAFEVVTGPVAFYEGLFGPTVVNLVRGVGIPVPPDYDDLPVDPDPDSLPDDKDDVVKLLVNNQLQLANTLIGLPIYDPMGLNDNLPAADGLVNAQLLQGDYFAVHTFNWAEFQIEPDTLDLLVTVWGVDAYSEDMLQADPDAIIGRDPRIVSQFRVHPIPEPGALVLAVPALGGLALLLIRRRRK